VRFPTPVHAASPLTSSSHAHDDELGCHRLAAGGGLGGLRATSFISSDRSLLRDTSCVAASALFCLHSGSSFSVRLRRVVRPLIESADQRSRLRPNCLMLNQSQRSHVAKTDTHTYRHPRTASTYTNTHTHTHTQTHIHTDIDTHTETHTLPQLTRLNTSHCTPNR